MVCWGRPAAEMIAFIQEMRDYAEDRVSDFIIIQQNAAALAEGVPVFNCEYALDASNDAYAKCYGQGFIPYCTRRSLSRLTTKPPPGYPPVAAGHGCLPLDESSPNRSRSAFVNTRAASSK